GEAPALPFHYTHVGHLPARRGVERRLGKYQCLLRVVATLAQRGGVHRERLIPDERAARTVAGDDRRPAHGLGSATAAGRTTALPLFGKRRVESGDVDPHAALRGDQFGQVDRKPESVI